MTLGGDLYGRSTPNFYGENNPNIEAVVPAGTRGHIMHVQQLNGGWGVEIKVLPNLDKSPISPRGSETAKVDHTYWVFCSNNKPFVQFNKPHMDPSSFLSWEMGTPMIAVCRRRQLLLVRNRLLREI